MINGKSLIKLSRDELWSSIENESKYECQSEKNNGNNDDNIHNNDSENNDNNDEDDSDSGKNA